MKIIEYDGEKVIVSPVKIHKPGLIRAALANFGCEFKNRLTEEQFKALESLFEAHLQKLNKTEMMAIHLLMIGQQPKKDNLSEQEIENVNIAIAGIRVTALEEPI